MKNYSDWDVLLIIEVYLNLKNDYLVPNDSHMKKDKNYL